VLSCVAMRVAMCCRAFPCVAECRCVLQCVPVYYSVLPFDAV